MAGKRGADDDMEVDSEYNTQEQRRYGSAQQPRHYAFSCTVCKCEYTGSHQWFHYKVTRFQWVNVPPVKVWVCQPCCARIATWYNANNGPSGGTGASAPSAPSESS